LDLEIQDNNLVVSANPIYAGKNVEIYSGSRVIFTGCFSKRGDITLSVDNRDAQLLLEKLDDNKKLYARLK